ncbi:Fanconi anemia group E protein, C-terminal, partial [Dillenia turbinata]
MEAWKPLFDIFLNSPTPESEASLWFQQSLSTSSTTTSTSTSSFLSLLMKPLNATIINSSASSSSFSHNKRQNPVMWVQSLPNAVQSRILSFLTYEQRRFCSRDLSNLAKNILNDPGGVDFWVNRAAHNLLDSLSQGKCDWISSLDLNSIKGRVDEEFEALPGWLKVETNSSLLLPWLPMSQDELNLRNLCSDFMEEAEMLVDTVEEKEEELNVVGGKIIESECSSNATPDGDTYKKADCLRTQILTFESVSKTVDLAKTISELCLDRGKDSLTVLGLIEPWKADEETAAILIFHLVGGREEQFEWPGQVLCSVILPRLLVLEEPASRVLLSATIEYCKLHQRAAEYALLFPLILRRGGINNPICDVLMRIIKECLHPAHVSAFCQKVLCGEEEAKKLVCLPCHQGLLSNKLVWTESLFRLFQNVLSHDVHLTQDSVNHLVYQIQELAERFSKSLRFGNFLLCFVSKCSPFLKSHKILLIETVEHTNTLVKKSIQSKLAA